MKKSLFAALLLFCLTTLSAQEYGGYFFGVKGGPIIGLQNWQGLQRQALFAWQGDIFLESLKAEGGNASMFGQIGIHQRGSAIRNRAFRSTSTGNLFGPPGRNIIFNNAVLSFGVKQNFVKNSKTKAYYLVGARVEYNLSTNLDQYSDFNLNNPAFSIYPYDDPLYIRDFTYGIIAGTGITFPISDFMDGLLEATFNPDFALQYTQPAIPNITDPYTGMPRTVPERSIRNITFEITAGIRFMRKVEYVD